MKNLEEFGVRIPEIMLPKNLDVSTWSVVACDQYTQDKEYWKTVRDGKDGYLLRRAERVAQMMKGSTTNLEKF